MSSDRASPGSIDDVLADPIIPTLIATGVVGLVLLAGLALAGVALGPKPSMTAAAIPKAKRRRFVLFFICPLVFFLCSLIACLSWVGHLDSYIRYYSNAVSYFYSVDLSTLENAEIYVSGTQSNGSTWTNTGQGIRQLSYVYTDVAPGRSPSLPVIFLMPPLIDGNIAIQDFGSPFVYSMRPGSWPQAKLFRYSVDFQCSPEWTRNDTILPFLDSSSTDSAGDSTPGGECPIGPSGSYPLSCVAEGGSFVRYGTPCVFGATCGYCELYLHLAEFCLYLDLAKEEISSFQGYCGASTSGPLYVAGPKPSAITLRMMSVYDPYIVLARLTNGTMKFDPAYRDGRIGMWVSAVLSVLWICAAPALWRKFGASPQVDEVRGAETDALLPEERRLREERALLARELPGFVGRNQPRVQHAIRGTNQGRALAPRLAELTGEDLARTSSQLLAEGHPCQICLARVADVKLLPCNHHCSCRSCTAHLLNKPCPLCRTLVTAMEACDPFAPSFIRLGQDAEVLRRSALSVNHVADGDTDTASGPVFESLHSIAPLTEPTQPATRPPEGGAILDGSESEPNFETAQSMAPDAEHASSS